MSRELVDLALVSEVRAVELVRELALALGRSLAARRAHGHADVVGAQGGDGSLGEALGFGFGLGLGGLGLGLGLGWG